MADTGSFSGTFTGSWTAIKIDITAGTGTLAQLVTDISDTTVMETVANVTTIKHVTTGVARELEISSGVTLNHQVDSHTLNWTWGAANTVAKWALEIGAGGTFNVGDGTTGGDDCILDFASNRQDVRPQIYHSGSFNVLGTVGHECIMKHYLSYFLYTAHGQSSVLDYFKLQSDITYTGGYGLAFMGPYYRHGAGQVSFDHGKVEALGAACGYAAMSYSGGLFDNLIFNNIIFENNTNAYMGGTYKMSNCTIKDMYSSFPRTQGGGKEQGIPYETSKSEEYSQITGQPKTVFDTCTFDNNYAAAANGYGFYAVDKGAVALFRDCIFQNNYYGARVHDAIIIWVNCTITATVDRVWAGSGTHLHGRNLTITVNDSGGSPLPNANVNVRQKEGYENWSFLTDANGQIKDMWGDDPVFIEKEETSTGVYDQWSDGNGDQVHIITISHPDYQIDTREVAFTQDRTIVAQLTANAVGVTTIYDSTFYDSTIY
jgi:hypothetical protein